MPYLLVHHRAMNPGLFRGQAMGQPFEVFAPDNRYVFVSSTKHISEIDSAPDTVLSLQAASKQVRNFLLS